MTTPKLTKIPKIKQGFFGRKKDDVALFNLKPIRKKIEHAVKEVTQWKPHKRKNFVTCTIKEVIGQFVEVTITVHRSTVPENGPSHPPHIPPPTITWQ